MVCRQIASRPGYRRGMVAIMAAVCFTVLLAAAALALDGGALLTERRHAQETADAAALAAADDLFLNYPANNGVDSGGTAASSAQTVATANGFSNDGTTSSVTVNIPPAGGNFTDSKKYPGYVEVILTYQVSRSPIGSIFGSGTIPVTARAVARGLWVPAKPQIIAFDLRSNPPPYGGGLGIGHSSGTIQVLGGPVDVDSSSAAAASDTSPASQMTAPAFNITGNYQGNFATSNGGSPTTGTRPVPDPLSYLPAPGGLSAQSNPGTISSGEVTLQPGSYSGSLVINGTATVHLQSGIYAIQGGNFVFTSTGTLDTVGGGVMIYVNPALTFATLPSINISATGSNPVILKPLTSGPYQGITIFQDQSAQPKVVLTGNGFYNITGTIYASNDIIQVTSSNDPSMGSQYMGRVIQLAGTSDWTITQLPQPSHTRLIGLVE